MHLDIQLPFTLLLRSSAFFSVSTAATGYERYTSPTQDPQRQLNITIPPSILISPHPTPWGSAFLVSSKKSLLSVLKEPLKNSMHYCLPILDVQLPVCNNAI